MQKYVILSLELHLFFARIMKEHSLFLEAGFVQRDKDYMQEADWYKRHFEKLLYDTVMISNGLIRENVLKSGEIFTEFTYEVEQKTQYLTGIAIDSEITLMEEKLTSGNYYVSQEVAEMVHHLNERAIKLLEGLINFKQTILNEVLSCNLFTGNYPLLLDHILREAKLYYSYVTALQNGEDISNQSMKEVELFWNQIMMEHAMFIRGLLDPSENELIEKADSFAKDYAKLLEEAKTMTYATMNTITNITKQETIKYRDFKAAGAKGIYECEIRSIIVPLLADHVLREANHYLRLLNS